MNSSNTAKTRASMPIGEAQDLSDVVGNALRQARDVRGLLIGAVIPALAPARRSFADHLVRTLERGEFFDEPTLRDIDAFMSLLQREIDVGTYVWWDPDEHHVRGGYERIGLDARARSLVPTLALLTKLRIAISTALDMTRATSIARDMISR